MIKTMALSSFEGEEIRLRLIELADAPYIFMLRNNPEYNRHLSVVNGKLEDQVDWISNYKLREKGGVEFYYIIERLNGVPCGAVRIYDIKEKNFTWGSWILDHNKPPKAALESALLVYYIAFGNLGLQQTHFDVRKENEKALSFHRRFGAIELGDDGSNVYFLYTVNQFFEDWSHKLNRFSRLSSVLSRK